MAASLLRGCVYTKGFVFPSVSEVVDKASDYLQQHFLQLSYPKLHWQYVIFCCDNYWSDSTKSFITALKCNEKSVWSDHCQINLLRYDTFFFSLNLYFMPCLKKTFKEGGHSVNVKATSAVTRSFSLLLYIVISSMVLEGALSAHCGLSLFHMGEAGVHFLWSSGIIKKLH